MSRAVVLVGSGHHQDPWHDFAATGHRVAGLIAELGVEVEVRSTKLDALPTVADADLVVVNSGWGEWSKADGDPDEWPGAYAALLHHREAGKPLLGLHAATNSLEDLPGWNQWLGGRWVRGTSMHPPLDLTRLEPSGGHPITEGLGPIEVADERYSHQQVADDVVVLLDHEHDGVRHPLVWTRTDDRGGRVVYDALGHGVESYDSPGRAELLRREVGWLLGR